MLHILGYLHTQSEIWKIIKTKLDTFSNGQPNIDWKYQGTIFTYTM